MKIRVKKIPTVQTSQSIDHEKAFEEFNEFVANCKNLQYSIPKLRIYLAQTFKQIFPSKPYPEEIPIINVRLALAYELLCQSYKKSGKPLPEKVLKNRNALQSLQVSKVTEDLRWLVEFQYGIEPQTVKTMSKEKVIPVRVKKIEKLASPEMKAKENLKQKTELKKKLTVAQAYINFFDRVVKGEKLTDLVIVNGMRKLFPDKKTYSLDDVRKVRSLYNKGKISCQKGLPARQIGEVK